MSENSKIDVTSADASVASFNLHLATLAQLVIAKVLTNDQAKFIAASAASMSRGQGHEVAATLIEAAIPQAAGANINIEAMKQGIQIKRSSRDRS